MIKNCAASVLLFFLSSYPVLFAEGKFKSIKESYYSLNNDVEIIKRYNVLTYLKNGKLAEEQERDSLDQLTSRTLYRYDFKQRLTKKEVYDLEGKVIYHSMYKYDKNDRRAECRNFANGRLISKSINFLNDSNKITKYVTYTSDNQIFNIHHFAYNELGLTKEEVIAYPDGTVEWRSESIYDEKGNLIVRNEYPSCCLSTAYTYAYDENGNLVLEKSIKADGSKGIIYSYLYSQVDQKRNWLVRIISENGKPTTLIKRRIEYFIP